VDPPTFAFAGQLGHQLVGTLQRLGLVLDELARVDLHRPLVLQLLLQLVLSALQLSLAVGQMLALLLDH
jgi:hypothetical protein